MKPIILCLSLFLTAPYLRAEDSSYRQSLEKLRHRCSELQIEESDYRKPKPSLTPEKEQELFRLQGQLLRDDPVAALSSQIDADWRALDALKTKTAADTALIETLKNLQAEVDAATDAATTRAQAVEHATALRQFVARRDVAGIKVWTGDREL